MLYENFYYIVFTRHLAAYRKSGTQDPKLGSRTQDA